MLWFALPLSTLSLVLTWSVFKPKLKENIQKVKLPIWAGFKQAFSSRSAIGCLVGIMLFYTTYAQSVYLVSFWKQVFTITTSIGALTIVVNASISASGSIVSGRLVNQIGRKTIGVITGFVECVFVAFTFFMPTFLLSWVFSMVRIWCWGAAITALNSLNLEQIPIRSTFMSLSGAFSGLGLLLGTILGGTTLNLFNYQAMGLVFGILGVASIFIIIFFSRENYTHTYI